MNLLLAFQKPTSIELRQWPCVFSPWFHQPWTYRNRGCSLSECSRRSNCEDNGKKSEKEKQREGYTYSFPPSPSISHHSHATIWMPGTGYSLSGLYPRLTRPCTQASSRYPSYQKRLGTECDIEFSRQAWQVTSHPESPRTTENEAGRTRHDNQSPERCQPKLKLLQLSFHCVYSFQFQNTTN